MTDINDRIERRQTGHVPHDMREDTDELDLSERQIERFREVQQELKEADPNLPKPTDDQVMKMLLDTQEAVKKGFYGPSDDELRELVEKLRSKQYELSGANERAEGYEYAADELEEIIDDEN